jgi:hypothetical protein
MKRTSARLKQNAESSSNAQSDSTPHSNATTIIPTRKRVKLSEFQETNTSLVVHADGDAADSVEIDADVSSEDEQLEAPKSRKRKRGGAKQTKGKGKGTAIVAADPKFKKVRGRLGLLHKVATEMPLDVIFEVLSFFFPYYLIITFGLADLHVP